MSVCSAIFFFPSISKPGRTMHIQLLFLFFCFAHLFFHGHPGTISIVIQNNLKAAWVRPAQPRTNHSSLRPSTTTTNPSIPPSSTPPYKSSMWPPTLQSSFLKVKNIDRGHDWELPSSIVPPTPFHQLNLSPSTCNSTWVQSTIRIPLLTLSFFPSNPLQFGALALEE